MIKKLVQREVPLDQMRQWFMSVQAQENTLDEPISVYNSAGEIEVAQPGDFLVQDREGVSVCRREEFITNFFEGGDLDARWHQRFYSKLLSQPFDFVTWKGTPIIKNPLDLLVYQELIWEVKPKVLLETGTALGGSASFFSDIVEGFGRVVTVDIAHQVSEVDPRVSYLIGDSVSPEVLAEVTGDIGEDSPVMVVLDSHHEAHHVLREMTLYGPLVPVGSYMVIEDSNLGGHPVHNESSGGEGPWWSIHQYLSNHDDFEVDHSRERFGVTFNPQGWLKKVK